MDLRDVKNVLLISHQMSRTGAPAALQYMARQLQEDGRFVTVLSPVDGPMVQEMNSIGITVIIDSTIGGNTEWLKWASDFDLLIVCTVVLYHNIEQLMGTSLPVLWWIHDGEMSFQLGADRLIPQKLTDNIHVYAGGQYACNVVNQYRPTYQAKNLLYHVPDCAWESEGELRYRIENPDQKRIFSMVGTIDKRKGQEIFAHAIELLEQEDIEKHLFVFVGKNDDETIYHTVTELRSRYPKSVLLIEEVSREEVLDVYRQSAAVICASRDDPMPVFMTECLMLGVPVICSDHTGTYSLLQDGRNGLTFESGNVPALYQKLKYAIDHEDEIRRIGMAGRQVYEDYFTREAFQTALYQAIGQL